MIPLVRIIHFVLHKDVLRAFELTCIEMTERELRIIIGDRFDEYGSPAADNHIDDHQVKFVDQAMRQQIIPKDATAKHDNVFTWFALERGDFVIDTVAADDRCGIAPRGRILKCEIVRYGFLSTKLFRRENSRFVGEASG